VRKKCKIDADLMLGHAEALREADVYLNEAGDGVVISAAKAAGKWIDEVIPLAEPIAAEQFCNATITMFWKPWQERRNKNAIFSSSSPTATVTEHEAA
jgi:hypothetical protein